MCAKVVDNSSSIFSNLPNHLILSILNINKKNKEDIVFKKKHDIVIKHLNIYFEEIEEDYGLDLSEGGLEIDDWGVNITELFKYGQKRWDTYLLENEDIFRDNDYVCENLKDEYKNEPLPLCLRPHNNLYQLYYKVIADKHGGEDEYDEWCDNYY
jgi:hypothetical protein